VKNMGGALLATVNASAGSSSVSPHQYGLQLPDSQREGRLAGMRLLLAREDTTKDTELLAKCLVTAWEAGCGEVITLLVDSKAEINTEVTTPNVELGVSLMHTPLSDVLVHPNRPEVSEEAERTTLRYILALQADYAQACKALQHNQQQWLSIHRSPVPLHPYSRENRTDMLTHAVNRQWGIDVIRDLLEAKADIKADGSLPVELAAEKGQTEVLRFLLQSGVDMNDNSFQACHAVVKAVAAGNVECVQVLLEGKADAAINPSKFVTDGVGSAASTLAEFSRLLNHTNSDAILKLLQP